MSSAEPSDNNSQKPSIRITCTACKSWYTFSTTSLQKRLQRAWLVESDVLDSSCRFALVIGIDNYAHCGKLGGAVRDAKAIKQYLEEALGVSEDHIYTLFDEEATRHAIINAFRKLQNDERIDRGDPIMIFYSGHGGEISPPRSWGIERKIQCLLPQDCETAGANPPTDRAPIPDRTIETLDDYIWGSRQGKIAYGFAYHGLRSHVLLAACGETELAYEHKGRGQFTSALLATLKSCAVNDLTYAGLLDQIQLRRYQSFKL
ncbi:hypothetical protein JVT61DRAFT_10652 [Boletus reticuloceps]|uniref:Peptidase C14 caspase domain-containing protein n=1 Tax=Boletus reticuloceps TaxID=495285 RepID=A0A8I2YFQ2_9AGAM|nr:hypothetical protein JVT61DRAFT_10652 [Boletus reticuloceps]